MWKYIGGSSINSNIIFDDGLHIELDVFYKIGTMLFALPNMFIKVFSGNRICPSIGLPMYPVASIGESSNVIDFIGFLYPSKGDLCDVFLWSMIMLYFGGIARIFFKNHLNRRACFTLSTWVFMTFFCFFSFFAVYGILSSVWEILTYSIIIPPIFSGQIKIGEYSLKI